MHLNISEPYVVAIGPDSRSAPWGPYQFPSLTKLPDGKILYRFHIHEDAESAYGSDLGCCISEDGGKTWTMANANEHTSEAGILLDNGDRIWFKDLKAVPVTDKMDLGPSVGHVTRKSQECYRIENISREICPETWLLCRIPARESHIETIPVTMNWKNRVHRVCRGLLIPPKAFGRIRKGHNGELWITHYDIGNDPETDEFSGMLANYLCRSCDDGRTWDIVHYLPYDRKDIPAGANADTWEGYGENDLTVAPDGSLVRLIRTNGGFRENAVGKSYIIHSKDNGATWSQPEVFDRLGVWPCLLTLDCGVTLATYGRPGFFLRATDDPSCYNWEAPIELVHTQFDSDLANAAMDIVATCSYSDMVALDDHTALVAYSDFTIKDDNGIPRKTMVARIITVEAD